MLPRVSLWEKISVWGYHDSAGVSPGAGAVAGAVASDFVQEYLGLSIYSLEGKESSKFNIKLNSFGIFKTAKLLNEQVTCIVF